MDVEDEGSRMTMVVMMAMMRPMAMTMMMTMVHG